MGWGVPRGSLFFQRLVDCLEFNPICLCGKDFFFFNLIFFFRREASIRDPSRGDRMDGGWWWWGREKWGKTKSMCVVCEWLMCTFNYMYMLGLSVLRRPYRHEPFGRDTEAWAENGRQEVLYITLETESLCNCDDSVDYHTEPEVEALFFFWFFWIV